MFTRILCVVLLMGLVGVCPAGRGKQGQSKMGAAFTVFEAGDKECPITEEVADNLEKLYGEPLLIVVVNVNNVAGVDDYVTFINQARAEGVKPVDDIGWVWDGSIPTDVSKLFHSVPGVAKGQHGVFAIAFHAPRGVKRLKSVTLRTGLTDEFVTCN